MISKSIITLYGVKYDVRAFTMLEELEFGLRLKKAAGADLFPLFVTDAEQIHAENPPLFPDSPNAVELALILLSQSVHDSETSLASLLDEALARCRKAANEGAEPCDLPAGQACLLAARACRWLTRNFFLELDAFSHQVAQLNLERDELAVSSTDGPDEVPIPDGWEYPAFLAAVLEYAPLNYAHCLKLTLKEFFDIALAALVECRRRLTSPPVHSEDWIYR